MITFLKLCIFCSCIIRKQYIPLTFIESFFNFALLIERHAVRTNNNRKYNTISWNAFKYEHTRAYISALSYHCNLNYLFTVSFFEFAQLVHWWISTSYIYNNNSRKSSITWQQDCNSWKLFLLSKYLCT